MAARRDPRLAAAALIGLLAPALAGAQGRSYDSDAVLDLMQQVDQLQREIRALRGEIEQQGDGLADLNRRQRELFLDLDRRLKRLEPGGGPAEGAPPPAAAARPPGAAQPPGVPAGAGVPVKESPAPAAADARPPAPKEPPAPTVGPAPGPAAASVADPLKEQAAYQQAFNLLKEGRYDQAARSFTAFLERYPSGPHSDNAQYWLGESHYVNRQYQPALAEFGKLLQRFPDSGKVSHAKLKMGLIYSETGQTEQAKKLLSEVVSKYPNTPQARLARERLDRLQ
jgi:tol-pal system protein YbgF